MYKKLLELISGYGDDDDTFKFKTSDEILDKLLINEKIDYLGMFLWFFSITITAYCACSKRETSFWEKFEKDLSKHMDSLETDYGGIQQALKNDSAKIKEVILLDIYSKFLKKDYTAPTKLEEILLHLRAFYLFYSLLIKKTDEISINTIQIFDFNLMRLLNIAQHQLGGYSKYAEIELERLYKSNRKKSKGKEERKKIVLAEFEKLKRTKKLSDLGISIKIKKNIEMRGETATTTETIKTYLKEEGKI